MLPIIGALICGFSLADISDFIGKGVGSTWQTAILFIFSVTYFGIMNDAGLFDKLVDGLVKKAGKNITLILIFTSIIAMIGHIDGAAATTYLITIPTMLPIYKKMHIRPTVLLLLCGAATGIMNLALGRPHHPRGHDPPTWMPRAVDQDDPHAGVRPYVTLIGIAIFLGMVETKRLAKLGIVALRPGGRRVRGDECRPVLKNARSFCGLT